MNIEQERAEFEAFASKHGLCVTEGGDLYRSHVVAWMWKAWQARAALQSQDREDAARYRWLRQQRTISDHACVTWNIGHDWVQMDGAELDAAIDHARRAREGG